MITFEGVRVVATAHATDQALSRVPAQRGATRAQVVWWIERTAAKAIVDGRTAKTMPRWCSRSKTRLGPRAKILPGYGDGRFLWNESQTAVMMVRRVAAAEGGGWVVLTVMAPEGRVRERSYPDTP